MWLWALRSDGFQIKAHTETPTSGVFKSLILQVSKLADGEGFEPSVPFKAHTLSRRARSTTLAPILIVCGLLNCVDAAYSQVLSAFLTFLMTAAAGATAST